MGQVVASLKRFTAVGGVDSSELWISKMTKRSVLAFMGDTESTAAIARLQAESTEIIAVAIDLGGSPPLGELHVAAVQAGATRCHVLDVREAFLRAVVLPALRAGRFASDSLLRGELAVRFINEQLQTIAEIEDASMVERRAPVSIDRGTTAPVEGPAILELAFSRGVPAAVNDVRMTLTELVDSVGTIAGTSPLDVIRRAYRGLPPSGDGGIVMRIENGCCAMAAAAVAV
jgi:argininosuccinate synthase